MSLPCDRNEAVTELALHVDGDAEPREVHLQRVEDLAAQVLVDRPAVDRLDHCAEDLPTARRVVAGRGAGLPFGRVRGDARDRLRVAHVDVVGAVVEHREPGRVGEHVTQRRPLLARAPAVDEVGDRVVEAEAALLPELEQRDRGQRLARRVPEHDVVGAQGPARPGLAEREVEERLAPQRDVDLGAVLPAVGDLALDELGHPAEIHDP